jgi:hypothetical protein
MTLPDSIEFDEGLYEKYHDVLGQLGNVDDKLYNYEIVSESVLVGDLHTARKWILDVLRPTEGSDLSIEEISEYTDMANRLGQLDDIPAFFVHIGQCIDRFKKELDDLGKQALAELSILYEIEWNSMYADIQAGASEHATAFDKAKQECRKSGELNFFYKHLSDYRLSLFVQYLDLDTDKSDAGRELLLTVRQEVHDMDGMWILFGHWIDNLARRKAEVLSWYLLDGTLETHDGRASTIPVLDPPSLSLINPPFFEEDESGGYDELMHLFKAHTLWDAGH